MSNATLVEQYFSRIYNFSNSINQFRSNLENKFNSQNLTQQAIIIKQYQVDWSIIMTDFTTWTTSIGTCKTTCKSNNVQVKNCSCYTTTQVTQYFSNITTFNTLEASILTYTGKGNASDLAQFKLDAFEIRKMFETFYYYLYNNYGNYDLTYISTLNSQTSAAIANLSNTWNAWKIANTPVSTACNLTSCPNANQVLNLGSGICACQTILDWDKLPGVLNSLATLNTTIKSLTKLPQTAINTLISNLNLIATGIPALQQYVITYQKNLDVSYTQLRCDELNAWYANLVAQVNYIQNSKALTVCDVTCPNIRWVYDPAVCSCTCNVNNCAIPTQKIDYFNCMCVNSTTCALTQSGCNANGGKILDYTNCVCKAAP